MLRALVGRSVRVDGGSQVAQLIAFDCNRSQIDCDSISIALQAAGEIKTLSLADRDHLSEIVRYRIV